MKKLKLNNEEKSAQLAGKARAALLVAAGRDWLAAEAAANEAGRATVTGINRLRACGEKLKQACGHEQMTLAYFVHFKDALPASMTYTGAKEAVHISNRISADVTTVQDAMLVQRDLFAALGDFKEPKRLEAQVAHDSNPWSEFVAGLTRLTALFPKLTVDAMQDWSRDKLSTFTRETQPIADANARAKQLLDA
jgi:hypothetical protein